MAKEIERKFLLTSDAWRAEVVRSARIVQGYLSGSPGPTVRVRRLGETAFLTVKGRAEGLSRDEFEYEIPVDDAEAMLRLAGRLVEKTRHYVECGAVVFEIDEFFGENAGLVVLEVELEREDQDFERPVYLGLEISFDRRFSNSALAERPYRTWTEEERAR